MRELRPSRRAGPALVVAAALAGSLLVALPARAAKRSVGCGGLQKALDNAVTGDVITLTKMCTGRSFVLPSRRITLKGAKGAGFDGSGAPSRLLTGTNVSTTTISDLIFRDAAAPVSGNAIYVDGTNSAPRILNSVFRNNGVADRAGGAVSIVQGSAAPGAVVLAGNTFGGETTAQGNVAEQGGGVYLSAERSARIIGNTFRNNQATIDGGALYVHEVNGSLLLSDNEFVANTAQIDGGAAYVYPTTSATIARNLFQGNRLEGGSPAPFARRGGGLFLFLDSTPGTIDVLQHDNTFRGNRASTSDDSAGAGEYVQIIGPASIASRNDRLIRNSIVGDGEGAGLKFGTANLSGTVQASLSNAVVAGNSIGGVGTGGGLYGDLNCISTCAMQTDLRNSTVSGNTIGSGNGSQSYMQSDFSIYNSIVYGDGTENDSWSLGAGTMTNTDICGTGGTPLPGPGNICADPQLRGPSNGDVHQTTASPTLDAGSNASVSAILKTDYEAHRRVLDSDNDGSKRVDMGADEMRTKARLSLAVRHGSVLVSGLLRPKNAGKTVVVRLARKRGGKFRTLSTKRPRLNRRSRYKTSFPEPAPGRCRVKVIFKGSATTLPGTKTKAFRC